MAAVGEGGGTVAPQEPLRATGALLVAASLLLSGGIVAMVLARRPELPRFTLAGYPAVPAPAARAAGSGGCPAVLASAGARGPAGGGAGAVLAAVPVGRPVQVPVTLTVPPGVAVVAARAVALVPVAVPPLAAAGARSGAGRAAGSGTAAVDLPPDGGTAMLRFTPATPGRYRVVVEATAHPAPTCASPADPVDVRLGVGVVDARPRQAR